VAAGRWLAGRRESTSPVGKPVGGESGCRKNGGKLRVLFHISTVADSSEITPVLPAFKETLTSSSVW